MTKRHANRRMRKDAPFRQNGVAARSQLFEMLPFVIRQDSVVGVIPDPQGTEAAYGLCKRLKSFVFYSEQNRRNSLNRPRPTISSKFVFRINQFGAAARSGFRCIRGQYRTISASTRRLMTKHIVRDPIYRRRRFDAEIIELCVRWYITYRLSYRDLAAMMAERGIVVSHTTILRWVNRYVPEFEKRWNRFARPVNTSWRVDETYINIRGKWNFLYRAVDKHGKTVDFLLRSIVVSSLHRHSFAKLYRRVCRDGRARSRSMATCRAIWPFGFCGGRIRSGSMLR
jgi:DDE domain